MTTRAALPPGTLLEDRYKIVSILRAGGMGALYCAHDTRLADSPCAVKEMLPQHDGGGANTDYIRRRFLEEMKVLARLNHPDIPRVRDYFVEGGLNYIVMDLVEGSNLLDALHERGQPLPAPEVVRLGLSILSILEYLHSHNPPTIHRDIKPANILIERGTGRFKLVDFGLACDASTGATVHTQVGTLGYCPLEQIQGKATPRSDIYALGATMHHLLTNEAPVPLQVKPLAKVRPDLPLRLVEIVNRALNAKPEQRFPDALSFRTALEKVQELLAPADNDPTGRIAPPSAPVELDAAPEPRPAHPDFYAAPPTQVQPSAWPWIIGLAVCVSMLLLGILVSRQNSSQEVASAPTPAPTREAPVVAVVPPPPAQSAARTPEPPVSKQPDFIPKQPAPVATPKPVARSVPTPAPRPRTVASQSSYPTYPTAQVREKPTPPPQAPEPPPEQLAPPRPEQDPPPPQQFRPQADMDASHYVAVAAPTGGWPGHPNEPWPTGPDGQPLRGVKHKTSGEMWPSRGGQLPLHLEGGGPPGPGQGMQGQGPPGQGMQGPGQGFPGNPRQGSRPPGY